MITLEQMMTTRIPQGKTLLINPEYVHYNGTEQDPIAVLPLGLLYAGQLLESLGTSVSYQDNQLHPLSERTDLDQFDSFGITVMGAQSISVAHRTYRSLLERGIPPEQIYFGGQGVEDLTEEEFQTLFPRTHVITTNDLQTPEYWSTSIRNQLDKISEEDMRVYLGNEIAIPLSQGCKYSCSFCGAQTAEKEKFFNVEENLEAYFRKAKQLGIDKLSGYVTSLDFFQQADGGNIELLKKQMRTIIDVQEKYGVKIKLRALTRADSYMKATHDEELMGLVKRAGFTQFGFGADGAADVSLLKAMRKGNQDLRSDLIKAFAHAESYGFVPEILYVFGITNDTPETLIKTRELCEALLTDFSSSVYRGFPAKDFIPGNRNWKKKSWKQSGAYRKLLADPRQFINLGFETLANVISHEDLEKRICVNREAVAMSAIAHRLGRVQSYLTIPLMETDGHELMDQETFETFKHIAAHYVLKEILNKLTLENLPEYREELNKCIPKDT
jgi:hypothetical protein